jgi:phosphoribosylformylglycinamidine cyclo-ligase
MNYKDSGVNTELAENLVKKHVSKFSNQIGKFAASVDTYVRAHSSDLVASVDGVGTKVLLTKQYKELTNYSLNNIGKDCVAMVMNDIACENAKPIMFMDYFATGKLDESDYQEVLSGMHEYCEQLHIPILGGETAELPGMFVEGAFDVCGFGLGIRWDNIVQMKEGDVVIGFESSGVHSNGFSLIRKIIDEEYGGLLGLIDHHPGLTEKLLRSTKLYEYNIDVLRRYDIPISGIAHITGGGFSNIHRVIPEGLAVSWNLEEDYYNCRDIFEWIRSNSGLTIEEMRNTFNCGIGMMAVVQELTADELSEEFIVLGEIVKCT